MAGLKSQKVSSSDVGNYSETMLFKVLHCGNIEGNNNKFYCIEKQKNPNTNEFRVFTHYGRLGKTNTYEVRGPADEEAVDKEFNRLLKDKLRTRKDSEKGHAYQYQEVQTFSPTVGSVNIRSKTAAIASGTFSPDFGLLKIDSNSKRIVRQVYEENIHNITTKTDIRMTSSGLETPLGPVTKTHIESARSILDGIRDNKGAKRKTSKFKDLNNTYFSKVPHPFGTKIPDDAWLDDDSKLLEEYDLLEQLEAAIKVSSSSKGEGKDKAFNLGFNIHHIDSAKELSAFSKMVNENRATNHRNLSRWNVTNAFEINLPGVSNRFKAKGAKMSPVKTLFHGSRNCNVLSILMNGLIIPSVSAGHVTGRLFGNGVYAASSSTKALNYSIGYWSRTRNKHPNSFLFLVEFGMGKIYETKVKANGPIRGYDSVWAKAGTSLYNDEYIVYDLGQVNITHLLELEEK